MSLYHETAEILSAPNNTGGNLTSRIFSNQKLKSPPGQVYALALETCKWSAILKEIIDHSDILRDEKKLTPVLALLLVHDFLCKKDGIGLPANHGLRASIERHKARLNSEFTRARVRRQMPTPHALKVQVDAEAQSKHPRWIRINTLVSSLQDHHTTTFAGFERSLSIKDLVSRTNKSFYIDSNVPNLVAVSPGTDFTKTEVYTSGAIILQDKASCFPAYLLNPRSEDGDVIDACAAPGNKTTHLAAIVHAHSPDPSHLAQSVFAFEKDRARAKTLEKMVARAGADRIVKLHAGQDFLKVDPKDPKFKNVGALLLDPSCSGSGIVGRDATPKLHLPDPPRAIGASRAGTKNKFQGKKRKAEEDVDKKVMVDDAGNTVAVASEKELQRRLEALSAFQLSLLLHAFEFPAARKVSYSTCSVHSEENENVVMKALGSKVAKERGWRVLRRQEQVSGLREWPVRGVAAACNGDEEVADAVVRSYQDDGRGVMGFFVAGFTRDVDQRAEEDAKAAAFLFGEDGSLVRDPITGMPILKSTGKPLDVAGQVHVSHASGAGDDDGLYARDDKGMIVRGDDGMPVLKRKEDGEVPMILISSLNDGDEGHRMNVDGKNMDEDEDSGRKGGPGVVVQSSEGTRNGMDGGEGGVEEEWEGFGD